ncbi:MAG: TatD family hydrolase [Fluviicola sp.]|nr:TatD family hydrolase [Fluviicola sp.]
MNEIAKRPIDMSLPVNIHTHSYNSNKCIDILSVDYQNFDSFSKTSLTENQFYSLAFHPMEWTTNGSVDFLKVRELIVRKKCVAIGEAGLDKTSPLSTKEQLNLFRLLMPISEENKLPIVIHCVGRWNELELLFKERDFRAPEWIIHGFRKTKLADKFIDLGANLSFGKALLTDESLQECVAQLPIHRVFLETDDADVDLILLYEKLAELKSLPLPAIIEQLFQNFKRVFRYG